MTVNVTSHQTEQGAARIQALTEAAAQLFLERGFEGVSVDELIRQVGGSRRNVYERFGGKQGLFVETIKMLCAQQAQPLRDLDIEGEDLSTALASFGREMLRIVLLPRTLALHRLMIAEGHRFPELAQAVRASGHQAGIDLLSGWIDSRRDCFRQDQVPQVLAEKFVTLLTSDLQLRALVGLQAEPLTTTAIAAHTRQTVSLFLYGVLRDGKVNLNV